ncbi:MAG: TatD family hydrolase [Firmicutes bacterium]|nr:TatD family hydrolase [Bacillota bacterium]
MITPLADTHAHLNDEQFAADWQEVVSAATANGVNQIIIPGSDLPDSRQAIAQAEQYPGLFAAVGVHPHEANGYNHETRLALSELADHAKIVAIGEIGLDYYYNFAPRQTQLAAFRDQMELAAEKRLPVIIHNRESHADMLAILKEFAGVVRGVLHCFSGSPEMAAECVKLGYYIGIGGTVTFKNAKKPVEVVRTLPLDRILLETDSPYLAPVPYRGRRNEPKYVPVILTTVAGIKGVSEAELRARINRNVVELFGIEAYNQ